MNKPPPTTQSESTTSTETQQGELPKKSIEFKAELSDSSIGYEELQQNFEQVEKENESLRARNNQIQTMYKKLSEDKDKLNFEVVNLRRVVQDYTSRLLHVKGKVNEISYYVNSTHFVTLPSAITARISPPQQSASNVAPIAKEHTNLKSKTPLFRYPHGTTFTFQNSPLQEANNSFYRSPPTARKRVAPSHRNSSSKSVRKQKSSTSRKNSKNPFLIGNAPKNNEKKKTSSKKQNNPMQNNLLSSNMSVQQQKNNSSPTSSIKKLKPRTNMNKFPVYGKDSSSTATASSTTNVSGSSENSSKQAMNDNVLHYCGEVMDNLLQHQDAIIFKKAVSKREYPEYYEAIENPMWLNRVKNKLNNQVYRTFVEFYLDLELIWDNAKSFNPEGHFIYDLANELKAYTEKQMIHFKLIDKPSPKKRKREENVEKNERKEKKMKTDENE